MVYCSMRQFRPRMQPAIQWLAIICSSVNSYICVVCASDTTASCIAAGYIFLS